MNFLNLKFSGGNMLVLLTMIIPYVFSTALWEASHHGVRNPAMDAEFRPKRQTVLFGCPVARPCISLSPFREFDGQCNNLIHPLWGSAGVPYLRFVPSQFREDLRLCKIPNNEQKCNASLPNVRTIVAALIASSFKQNTSKVTVMNMEFGQTISHDINNTPTTSGLTCCVNCSANVNESTECLAIDVKNDTFYSQFNVTCLQLSRSTPANFICTGGAREPVNRVTAFIDLSLVYGNSGNEATRLRTFINGTLKTFNQSEILSGQCPASTSCPFQLLPTEIVNGNERLLAGDSGAAQQPALTSIHHLFIRIHNDFAIQLNLKYPTNDDETIFQISRKAAIGLFQHITYNEYLPSILSDEDLDYYGLRPKISGYFTEYDASLDATLHNSFSTAAFRFGHSLVPDNFTMADGNIIELSKSFGNFRITYNPFTYPSNILNGISIQQSPNLDQVLVASLTNKLFASGPNFLFGSDLFSRNILRGRDHNIPPYHTFRAFCNLPPLSNKTELKQEMQKGVGDILYDLYNGCIENIDLYPALLSERPKGNGIVGPTLSCLLAIQFKNLKYGDRFFYEGNSDPEPFTSDQLESIKRTTLGAVLCRYTNTPSAPLKALETLVKRNILKPCRDLLPNTMMTDFDKYW